MTNHTPEVPQKQCSKCKEWLPATAEYFHRNKASADGLVSACKECLNRQTREARAPYRLPKPEQRPGFKQCSKCNEWKPIQDFHKRAASKDGLAPKCKECRVKRYAPRPKSTVIDGMRNCTKCNRWLPATTKYFVKQSKHSTGLSSHCKECFKKIYDPRIPNNGVRSPRSKPVEFTCPECGKVFKRKASKAKRDRTHYCSKACAYAGYGKRHGGENSPHYSSQEAPCDYCGKTLLRTASKINGNTAGHFCDGECYGKWREQNMMGEAATRWNGGEIKVPCLQCGVDVELAPSQVRDPGNFCCRKCYDEWRTANGIAEDSPLWKGGRLPYYGPSWKRQRRKAWQRDNHTCQECGATKEDTGREPDVHHILPFRLFGVERHEEANHLSNLICLCKRCHGIAELRDYVPDQSE